MLRQPTWYPTQACRTSRPKNSARAEFLRYNAAMSSRSVLVAQLIAAILLAVLDVYFGISRSYYYFFTWFDIVTHLVGGLWAGFLAAWLFVLLRKPPRFFPCLMVIIVIGVGWEIFEATTGITNFPADALDTIKDLIMDTLGGTTGLLFMDIFRTSGSR